MVQPKSPILVLFYDQAQRIYPSSPTRALMQLQSLVAGLTKAEGVIASADYPALSLGGVRCFLRKTR
jgi:hypothetical protein